MPDWIVLLLLFALYILYVVLPLVPAIILFRMFPNTKVAVRGPFQNWQINATGAFGAYLVTVLLGYAVVRSIQTTLDEARQHVYQGVIILDANVALNSDRFYAKFVTTGEKVQSRSYNFMILENQSKSDKWPVDVQLWVQPQEGGIGAPPPPKLVRFYMRPSILFPARYRVERNQKSGEFEIKHESESS